MGFLPGGNLLGAAAGADVSGLTFGYDQPPGKTLGVTREVVSYTAPVAVFGVRRIVGILTPPVATLAVQRKVYWYSVTVPGAVLGIQRRLYTETAPGAVLGARRVIYNVALALRSHQRWQIYLDGTNITSACSLDINISFSEGQNATAVFRFKPELGEIDIPSLQRRPVEIRRWINGVLETLFVGKIERPVYDYSTRRNVCNCSDFRSERLGNENFTYLKSLTGGVFSSIVQNADAEGADRVAELMKTVPGTLNYDRNGNLLYAPWALGTPKYYLVGNNVRRQNLSFSFAEGGQIVNRMELNVDYRYYRKRARLQEVTAGVDKQEFHAGRARAPYKDALLEACEGFPSWQLLDYTFDELPDPGKQVLSTGQTVYWSPVTSYTTYTDGERTTVRYDARDYLAYGIDAEVVRYISQPVVERYKITLTAPESIDQFGVIKGASQTHAVETDVDPDVWEETIVAPKQHGLGLSIGKGPQISSMFGQGDGDTATGASWPPQGFTQSSQSEDWIAYADDKRSDLQASLQAGYRIILKEFLAAHRKNEVTFIHKAASDSIIPLDIGDTVDMNTNVVVGTGIVKAYSHDQDARGFSATTLTLAFSRVYTAVTTSSTWSLPAAPGIPEQSRKSAPIEGVIEQGIVELTVPEVNAAFVDEVIGTKTLSYTVQIPRDPLSVYQTGYRE